jgi:hypothetical protein
MPSSKKASNDTNLEGYNCPKKGPERLFCIQNAPAVKARIRIKKTGYSAAARVETGTDGVSSFRGYRGKGRSRKDGQRDAEAVTRGKTVDLDGGRRERRGI